MRREFALRTLGQLGDRVHAVTSGPGALACLGCGEPADLPFAGIAMSAGMNGHGFAPGPEARMLRRAIAGQANGSAGRRNV